VAGRPSAYQRRRAGDPAGEHVVPPHPSRVDLHTHSNRSDGVLAPAELVQAAAAAGVRVLALADHDTLAGVRELLASGQLPLELLPAVEINSVASGIPDLWEGELHILGLGVDPADEAFEAELERQRTFRASRFHEIIARLRELGYPIEAQANELLAGPGAASGASLGRPQAARCLVAAGHVESVEQGMRQLLGRGCPAYVPRQGLGPFEAIAAILAAGGVPVLAHFADAPGRRELIEELVEAGLAGLEVHYRHFDVPTVAGAAALAEEIGLLATGGSDYHGDGETYAQVHAQLYVPDNDALALYARLGRPFPDLRVSAAP
jgi:predicted metal-dependent phosphoesterase TrpH